MVKANPVQSVNFHLWKPCNERCTYCFTTFDDVKGFPHISCDEAVQLIRLLGEAGCQKLTFAGGEPTLCPYLGVLLAEAHRVGLTTCIVTNGARLRQLLESQSANIDWLGFDIDSANEAVRQRLGRGNGDYVARTLELFALGRSKSIRTKLNTVVTALNCDEDMSALVRRVRPDRWKIFQYLVVGGQNDSLVQLGEKAGRGRPEEVLRADASRYRSFLDRHVHLAAEGITIVGECTDAIVGSYAMIDPQGRFFSEATGDHVYSEPILAVGVMRALEQVGFSPAKLVARGGIYDWRR